MRNTTISALTKATFDVVCEFGRGEFLMETSEKEVETMLHKVRKSYIGYYENDIADEILVDAWLYVFKQNGAKNIRMFDGYNPNTGKSLSMVSYLYFLLRNAVINYSKARKMQYLNESGISGFENESDSDSIGRAMYDTTLSQVKTIDEEYLENLQTIRVDCINTLREIQEDKRIVNNKERNIKHLNSKIKKLNEEIEKEQDRHNKVLLIDQDEWNIEDTNTAENEDRSLGNLLSRIKLTDNQAIILIGLIGGIKANEISEFLEVGSSVIKDELECIKDEIRNISGELAVDGDDSLESILDFYEDIKAKNHRQSEKRQSVCKSYKKILEYWIGLINDNNDKMYNQFTRVYYRLFGEKVNI